MLSFLRNCTYDIDLFICSLCRIDDKLFPYRCCRKYFLCHVTCLVYQSTDWLKFSVIFSVFYGTLNHNSLLLPYLRNSVLDVPPGRTA